MVEPLTTVAAAGFFGSWAARKLTDTFWKQLESCFRPDVLRKQIESQLRGDELIQVIYEAPPTLDRDRLTPERISELLKATVTSDVDSLRTYLLHEQLFTLPSHTKAPLSSFDDVWRSIAHAVIRAVEITIVKDDELRNTFLLAAQQIDHQLLSRIETGMSVLLQQAEKNSGAIDVKLSENVATPSQTGVVTECGAARTINLLNEENERLEQQLRDQLDEKTEQLWEQVLYEIQRYNFLQAVAKGRELHQWVSEHANLLSPDARGRTCLLLAQLALMESSEGGEVDDDFSKSRDLFEKARQEFGADVSEENRLRLLSFEAKLTAIDGKNDEAIALLRDATDHHSVTTRLLIHIDAGAVGDAAAFVRDLTPSEKWCEHGVYVLACSNAVDDAERMLKWAIDNGDSLIEHRCRIAFSRAVLIRINTEYGGRTLSILSAGPEEQAAIDDAFSKVRPIVEICKSRGNVETGLEADAVALAYTCCRLITGRLDRAREYIQLLRDQRPVNLEFARAVFRDDVDVPANLIDSLRCDYPNDFEAQDLAVALEVRQGCSPSEVLDRVEEMEHFAKNQEQRDKLARSIIQACTASTVEVHERAKAIAERIVGKDHRALQLVELHEHLLNGNLEACEQILASLPQEDHLAAQFRAQLLLKQGRHAEAAEALATIGQRMSEPDILKEAARLAFEASPRRLDIVVQALEDALLLQPRDLVANCNLTFAYVDLQVFAKAAECLSRLRELEPNKVEHALNHAKCLELCNCPNEAVPIYDNVCRLPAAPLRAHLMRACLLCDLGKPRQGFQALHEIRDDHWEDYGFVFYYMETAYKANMDRLAFEGFEQLWRLRESGQAPPKVMEPRPFDDLVKFGEAERDRRNFLHDQSLVGKLPWTFVERLLGTVPYLGWRARTQPVPWVFDDPRNRASLAIYATNGYGVLVDSEGERSLERIACPNKGTPIVVDMSALITLHRLGLLAEAIQYFERVRIPPSYLKDVVRHSGMLQPHQLSQKTRLERIKAAIGQKQLHVVSDPSDGLFVDEYSDDDEGTYRLQDLLQTLHDCGHLTEVQLERASRVAKKPARFDQGGKRMTGGDRLVVDLSTLTTVVEEELFDALLDVFDHVSVLSSDQERAVKALQSFEAVAETQRWHEDLWDTLTNDARIDSSTPVIRAATESNSAEDGDDHDSDDDTDQEETEQDRITAIDATLLAQQEHLPLLADDRVCQNMALHSNRHDPFASFGTDILLRSLCDSGVVEQRKVAAAFLQLIDWRYRFLVVPAEVLRTLFDHFPAHDLRRVAAYVHDCMRDPGLFGGPEPTNPPLPIAFRYYQDWLQEIANFLADVWVHSSVNEDRATDLTRWVTTEFVPTVPKVLGAHVGRVANFSAFTVLHHTMVRLCSTTDLERANTALRTIASGLGLDNHDFIRVSADVINTHGYAHTS